MNIPEHIISNLELRRNTGERGTRMWIAHNGIIYDVTDCPKWRTGMHEFLHFPGQDLTSVRRIRDEIARRVDDLLARLRSSP